MITGYSPLKCRVGNHDLVYFRAGAGETVVLVHGITTYSFIWRRIFPALAASYDVVALDLLGCGASDMPLDESYALPDHASRLEGFCDALGLGRIHLLGHDLGGGIGQIFAVRHQPRLQSLALLNSVGYDYWPVQPITAMRTPIIRQLLMSILDRSMFRRVVSRGIHRKDRVTAELMDLFMAPLERPQGRKAFLHFARCLDNRHLMEIAPGLRRLDLPVLVMRGADDAYLNSKIALRLHREIPGSILHEFAQAGHFCQEDVPELITRTWLEFAEGARVSP